MSRSGEMAGRQAERAPLGWAAVAAALALSVSPQALAQAQAAPATAERAESIVLEADEVIDDDEARIITARGDVQVRYQGRTMRADSLVYNLETGEIRAVGDVQIASEDGTVTYAEEIDADEAMNVGAARELRSRLGGTGTLVARSAVRRGEGESELRNVIYTSCPICTTSERPPTWSLRARRAIQDRESRTISYRNAVLEVAGVPVLYMPFLAHPDPSVGRASGLLPPKVGRNDRLGTFYQQPYFWAISPSSDLTASLRLHGTVNPMGGLEYRRRFWSGSMEVATLFTDEAAFDSNGARFGEQHLRYSVLGRGLFRINDFWNWGFGVEHIYDDDFLRRYDLDGAGERRGPYLGTTTRLINQLFALGQDENSYGSIAFVGFQGLRENDTSALLPRILPVAEYERVVQEPLLDGQLRLQASTAALVRNSSPGPFRGDNARASASATWRRDAVFGPGMVFSPFALARGDFYRVETAEDRFENVGRGLGLAGAEVSWPFMRPGERFDLVVEPVVMGAWASEAQADPRIVNEDSLSFELDDSSLFRANAAPNYDLWEPGARVSAGVRATARARTGESASLTVGRRWRETAAAAFTQRDNLGEGTSDWVASGQIDLGSSFGAETRLRMADDLHLQRLDLGVRGRVGRFSAYGRYFSVDNSLPNDPADPNEEISADIGVDLARGWRMQFGVTKDLDSDINLRQDIRAIYEDDCTFLEIAYTRSETERGGIGAGEGLQIRVGLRSLGVIGGG